jgi:FtsZ-binding cell division protein ZapB
MEIETIKKSQMETNLEIENLGNISGVMDTSITNRIKEIEERISGAEDTIENIDIAVKENANSKNLLIQKHPGNPGQNEKTKPKNNRFRREQRFTT